MRHISSRCPRWDEQQRPLSCSGCCLQHPPSKTALREPSSSAYTYSQSLQVPWCPAPRSSQGTCWEFSSIQKPSRSSLSSVSCSLPGRQPGSPGARRRRRKRRKRWPRERSCSLQKRHLISTSRRTSGRKETHAKVKDEKKTTERGWSENNSYGEEFHRLPEKEALVFHFGQRKKKSHHPTTNPICSQQLCRAAHSSG